MTDRTDALLPRPAVELPTALVVDSVRYSAREEERQNPSSAGRVLTLGRWEHVCPDPEALGMLVRIQRSERHVQGQQPLPAAMLAAEVDPVVRSLECTPLR